MFSRQNLTIFLIVSLICLLLSFSGCTNVNAAFIGTSSPIEVSQYNQLAADVNSIGLTDGLGVLNYFKLSDLNFGGGGSGTPFDANCPTGEVLRQVDSNGGYVCVVASASDINLSYVQSNFVPYQGASQDLNLGDNSFTTGNISGEFGHVRLGSISGSQNIHGYGLQLNNSYSGSKNSFLNMNNDKVVLGFIDPNFYSIGFSTFTFDNNGLTTFSDVDYGSHLHLDVNGDISSSGHICDSVGCIGAVSPDDDSNFVSWVDGNAWYYKKTDFNYLSFLTSSSLTPYLLQSDGNVWYYKKTDFNYLSFLTSSSLTPYLLQSDGNVWYYKRTDFNYLSFLTSSSLTPYLLQSDGNVWYEKKLDLNADINALINPRNYLTSLSGLNLSTGVNDLNWQTLANVNVLLLGYTKQVDGNAWYYKKTDFNYLTFLTDAPIDGNSYHRTNGAWTLDPISVSSIDTNWQTSFGVFDTNMKATYLQLPSTSPLSLPTLVNGQYLTNNGSTLSWSAVSSSVDTNMYTAGIMRADNNALLIDLNGGGKSLFGFLDGNFTRNVFIDGNLTLNGVIKHSTCPSGYVLVPGDSNFGTNDFCVMKYEAQKSAIMQAVSIQGGTPWTDVSWYDAREACKRAGAHLITNAEWMTIARNISNQSTNWQSGTVGSGCLYGGHMDNLPANKLATADDSLPYSGTNTVSETTVRCPFLVNVDNNKASRRTMTLSNGSVVWDISGNVWEWADEQCANGSGMGSTYWYNSGAWAEWSNANLSDYELYVAGPTSGYTSANGTGQYYGCTTNGNGLLRGAYWSDGVNAGVFAMSFGSATTYSGASVGFRCVR